MAGIDGVINEIEPPDPVDQNLYEMSAADLAMIRQVPGSLDEALASLERDNEFLMRGGVFTDDLIETWLDYKKNDVDDLRLRPHPIEFFKYFDA
jgi:glutamine synthetase